VEKETIAFTVKTVKISSRVAQGMTIWMAVQTTTNFMATRGTIAFMVRKDMIPLMAKTVTTSLMVD